ncbi:uncharacterized protein RCC_03923 [Ramularia collo-cygni]|uniref:Uncharacterized protein n=1 Tax=Ramularia collo-cygni TaxID=112498 RepID=A0A2D3V6D2_9PEZI|nr:uncharacterized protein RCC_03923 [Ramularia collo-cygni]CZT18084.1 uncharacterized protein RCC_03923 [Ramularia collo-cygni]
MSFKQDFEHNLNNDMQGDGQPGRAPTELEDVELDDKKAAFPHEEINDSKEQPPRFSTLYGVASAPKKPSMPSPPPPPPPPPAPVATYEDDYHREYYGSPPRSRKSGVTIPMPLFIVLAITFAVMSTIIFAYTVIGLYNNAPSRVFPWAGPGSATAVCNPVGQQPAINFSPKFVMPQAGKAVVPEASFETVTVSATPSTVTISATPSTSTVSATPSTVTVSNSSTSSSSTVDPSVAASAILGVLGGLGTTSATGSTAIVTVKPTQSTVTSVALVTKDPSGNIISDSMVTLTSTTVVPPSITSRAEASTLAAVTSASPTTGWSAVSSALESAA